MLCCLKSGQCISSPWRAKFRLWQVWINVHSRKSRYKTHFVMLHHYYLPGIRKSGRLLCDPGTAQCSDNVNITLVASSMCRAWAHIFTFLRPDGVGTQISQDNAIGSWLPCTVFCQTNTGTWYSPRRELMAYYLSAVLPDGTLCSNNEDENLFCQVSSNWKIQTKRFCLLGFIVPANLKSWIWKI